ncbi:hypothetical protein ATANTOWER_009206 [Ataeniobius toweri]|uniref:Uncharacterized protein n=1 Tax=Ataeniobius toweri TaxID=208326 RepID=A0ABU7APY9_9TELE|nr:hypothetical protein [Ataeniobius toweri]
MTHAWFPKLVEMDARRCSTKHQSSKEHKANQFLRWKKAKSEIYCAPPTLVSPGADGCGELVPARGIRRSGGLLLLCLSGNLLCWRTNTLISTHVPAYFDAGLNLELIKLITELGYSLEKSFLESMCGTCRQPSAPYGDPETRQQDT